MKPHIDKYFKYVPLPPPIPQPYKVLIKYDHRIYLASSLAEWRAQYFNEKGEFVDNPTPIAK